MPNNPHQKTLTEIASLLLGEPNTQNWITAKVAALHAVGISTMDSAGNLKSKEQLIREIESK